MIVLTEQAFAGDVECTRTMQFDSVEEFILYCEYWAELPANSDKKGVKVNVSV